MAVLRDAAATRQAADSAGQPDPKKGVTANESYDSAVKMSSRKRVRSEDDDEDSVLAEMSPLLLTRPQAPRKIKADRPFVPQMDKYEHKDRNTGSLMVTVMFGLPGLQPGDVSIDLLHDKLTISGESIEPPFGEGTYIMPRELQRGRFSRVVTVSLGLRLEDFKARMENGLLTVTFPKNPPGQKPQRIPIESTHL